MRSNRRPAPYFALLSTMHLHFLGICGTAMGNAALLLRAAGHTVTGCDAGVYPPMSEVLAAAGIAVDDGYDPRRVAAHAPDLVVVGNALSRGNPVVEWLLDERAVAFASLPALLHDRVLRHRRNIVVAGTHGKTTTTALAAFLLREAGLDPGFLIGGVPLDPPAGTHLGAATDPFVIEGDEYDSAFFDKRSKFIHYAPHVAVLNNLEFDHADIFRDLADVQRTFAHFTRIVPGRGWIVRNGDDPNLAALGPCPWTQQVRVGTGDHNDVRLVDFAENAQGARFALLWHGEPWAEVSWSLPGLFNARNAAMAATAAALAVGGRESLRLDALARFRGVKRRQETLHRSPALVVIEDFGHHPTALRETLAALRARHPGGTLTAVFEPRSNTARTRVLQDDFARALAGADEVYLGAVDRAAKLAATERFDAAAVVAHLSAHGVAAHHFAANADLLAALVAATLPGDPARPRVVTFFSNGSFDGIVAAYARAVAGRGGLG